MPGCGGSWFARVTRKRSVGGPRPRTSGSCRPTGRAARDDTSTVLHRDQLERGLQQLAAEQAAIFVLHHYVRVSLPEIADELGIPLGDRQVPLAVRQKNPPGGARRRLRDSDRDGTTGMTSERDFDRIAMAWLPEGPNELSDRVLISVDRPDPCNRPTTGRMPRGAEVPPPTMTLPARVPQRPPAIGVLALGNKPPCLGQIQPTRHQRPSP